METVYEHDDIQEFVKRASKMGAQDVGLKMILEEEDGGAVIRENKPIATKLIRASEHLTACTKEERATYIKFYADALIATQAEYEAFKDKLRKREEEIIALVEQGCKARVFAGRVKRDAGK